jgi:hypothetical protein
MLNGGRGQAVKALGCEPMIAGSNPVVRPFEGCDALCSQAGDNKPLLIQIVPRPLRWPGVSMATPSIIGLMSWGRGPPPTILSSIHFYKNVKGVAFETLANESILACKVNCKGSLKTKCYLTCVFVNYEI